MSNLTVRVIVAATGIPVIVALTILGGIPFFLLIASISTAALLEYYRLARARGEAPQMATGVAFGLALNAAFFHHRVRTAVVSFFDSIGTGIPFPSMAQSLLILFLLFVPLILIIELFRNRPSPARNIGATISGVCTVPLFLGALIGIRELFIPQDFPVFLHFPVQGIAVPPEVSDTIYRWGGHTVLSILASIWVCDSAAYFVGVRFGRHRLFPRVSPNKTWEGAAAGFAGAVATFAIARAIGLPYMSAGTALAFGAIIGIFGQLGDMVESLIKRDSGVKDSSSLIPGHGGVLDRFDSLIFVSPLLFLILDFIVF